MPRSTKETFDSNKHIGQRIKELRVAKGISRQKLTNTLDVTHQQLAKYESGANRITACRLQSIAKVLEADIMYFFDSPVINDDTNNRMMMEISRHFKNIKDIDKRHSALNIVKALAS